MLSLFAGALLGSAAIQGLHAQSKAPVYVVEEIDDMVPEMYAFYVLKIRELIEAHGGRVVTLDFGNVTAIEGHAPPHAAVQMWDSMDQVQAYRNDPKFKELRQIAEKYAPVRSFAVEGLPQQAGEVRSLEIRS
jgi:uncharacterized protein (DUF1330 family)